MDATNAHACTIIRVHTCAHGFGLRPSPLLSPPAPLQFFPRGGLAEAARNVLGVDLLDGLEGGLKKLAPLPKPLAPGKLHHPPTPQRLDRPSSPPTAARPLAIPPIRPSPSSQRFDGLPLTRRVAGAHIRSTYVECVCIIIDFPPPTAARPLPRCSSSYIYEGGRERGKEGGREGRRKRGGRGRVSASVCPLPPPPLQSSALHCPSLASLLPPSLAVPTIPLLPPYTQRLGRLPPPPLAQAFWAARAHS